MFRSFTKIISSLTARLLNTHSTATTRRGRRRREKLSFITVGLECRQLLTAAFGFDYVTIASDLSPTLRFFGSPNPGDAPFTVIRYGEGRITSLTELGLGYLSPADVTFKFGSDNPNAPVEVATLSSFDNGLGDGVANQIYTPDANDQSKVTIFNKNIPVAEGHIERIALETNTSFAVTSSRSSFIIDRPLGTDTRIYDELVAASKGTRVIPFSLSAFNLQGGWIGVGDAEIFTSHGTSLFPATAPNRAPTNVNLSSTSIAENRPVGTEVGTLTSTDPDEWQVFSYSLAGTSTTNPDNAKFTIIGNKLKTNATFNAAQKGSYSIRIKTTDQRGLSFEKNFTITVTGGNHAPTGLSLSTTSVQENKSVGTTVGTLTGVDPDASQTLTYTLVGTSTTNPDNAKFTITGNTLKTAAIFNFESKPSYSIRVQVKDQGGLVFEKNFTITVTNVNEAPTALTLSASAVLENKPSGTTVGTLAGVDPDASQTLTYTLVGTSTTNPDNAKFTITGNTLKTAAIFNFESKPSYSIRVQVKDQGGLVFEKNFTITVTNVNEAPTALTLSPSSVLENKAVGTEVGTLVGVDPDASQTLTYTLVDTSTTNPDNAKFTIVGNKLKTAAVFDFEAKKSYTIRVQVKDQNGLTFIKIFTVSVTDVANA